MNRHIAIATAVLIDVAVFCALIGDGASLRTAHIASFTVAMSLNYLLKAGSMPAGGQAARGWRSYCRLAVVAFMALFLRGGVLCLLSLGWGWPAQVSILFAVMTGLAVTTWGNSYVLSPAEGGTSTAEGGGSPAEGGARTYALAIGLIAYAFMLRLVYSGSVELLPEEAYYWNYSRHLDIGYLDHPPMVAWLIRLGTAAFGQSQFGVRIGALCCAAVASVFT